MGQNAGSVIEKGIIKGVPPATKDGANPIECVIGSNVNWIYLEFHFSAAQTGNVNVIHWCVVIERTNQTLSIPSLYNQPDRAQIIKRGMEMIPTSVSTVFKRIVLVPIPKIYRRVRDDMTISFRYIASSTQTINACGFAIYKEKT